ncbi:hypothetical protein AB1Y20_014753 [Prymnesium parvum]|uniref:PX domain-containing protein n=1 Tax=Prymnesium parvum TaxID=97485 RepID=A0AB34ICD4_PRYPA
MASTSRLPHAHHARGASEMKRSLSLPVIADAPTLPTHTPPSHAAAVPSRSNNRKPPPRLCVRVTGAEVRLADEPGGPSFQTLYTIQVLVGGQELESRRRYSEFRELDESIRAKYSAVLASRPALPRFPPKQIFRPSHHPDVIQERVRALDAWLSAIINVFQFIEVHAVIFLGLPFYLAVRVITGDSGADDFTESRSPNDSPDGIMELNLSAGHRSPDTARLSMLEDQLPRSLTRPGYWEVTRFLAKAMCWHMRLALLVDPCFAEVSRFVHAICGRAFFKPSSIICAVVYLDRLPPPQLRTLLLVDGWQLTLMTLLIISAKQWDSDYPISTADVCSQNWGAAGAGAPYQFTAQRVNSAERRILSMLDYCTVVSQTEYARYYLTLPFTYPLDADEAVLSSRHLPCHLKAGDSYLSVPPSMSCSAIRDPFP